jgi:type VI secretion system secreted protein Hcp
MILLNFKQQIKGDSAIDGHADWITIDNISLGVGRAISSSGGGLDREVSNPSFSEISLSKSTDIASPDLWYQAIQGKSLGDAEIHFVQTGAEGTSQVYLKIKLTDAIISSYQASGAANHRPSESLSLNFTKIEYQYDQFTGTKIVTGTPKKWDVMANKTF